MSSEPMPSHPRQPHGHIVETVIVLAAVGIAAASARDFAVSANDSSRLATVQCLVDYHTLAIDRSVWFEQTIDKIRPRPTDPFTPTSRRSSPCCWPASTRRCTPASA